MAQSALAMPRRTRERNARGRERVLFASGAAKVEQRATANRQFREFKRFNALPRISTHARVLKRDE